MHVKKKGSQLKIVADLVSRIRKSKGGEVVVKHEQNRWPYVSHMSWPAAAFLEIATGTNLNAEHWTSYVDDGGVCIAYSSPMNGPGYDNEIQS